MFVLLSHVYTPDCCKIPYSHAYNPQFFCSDCGVQNLVRILYKNTKFLFFIIFSFQNIIDKVPISYTTMGD